MAPVVYVVEEVVVVVAMTIRQTDTSKQQHGSQAEMVAALDVEIVHGCLPTQSKSMKTGTTFGRTEATF